MKKSTLKMGGNVLWIKSEAMPVKANALHCFNSDVLWDSNVPLVDPKIARYQEEFKQTQKVELASTTSSDSIEVSKQLMRQKNSRELAVTLYGGYGRILGRTPRIKGDDKAYEEKMSNGLVWGVKLQSLIYNNYGLISTSVDQYFFGFLGVLF